MDQIRQLLASLSLRQKISIGLAALAVLGGLFWLMRFQEERDFIVLFSELSTEDAATVVARLKERNVEYRLSGAGSSIRVRSAAVNELRLEMAAAGIPKTGRIGFELFDRNNFGITEFTEQVNYHRALEGEMERTVTGIDEVEFARVHITPTKDSVFEDQRRAAKASVMVKLKPMRKLSAPNVKAITHLLASAVEGLTPEAVAVLDVHGNLLTRPPGAPEPDEVLNQSMLAYKRSLERDLLAKVNATLEPLLGPDRFRAAVAVECDLQQSEQSEETYDPDSSVMTTSQRSEEAALAQTAQGVPGVASNLPRPTSRPGGAGQGLSRRTENLAFQTSRMIKKSQMPQGNLRRVSVSVLLDHIVRWEGSGAKARRLVEAPSAERMKATRDLVAAAVGFQPVRGDLVVVESLPFESTLAWQSPPAAPAPTGPAAFLRDSSGNWNLLLIGALAGAALVVVAGCVFLLTRRRRVVIAGVRVGPAPAVEGRVPESGAAGALQPGDVAGEAEAILEDSPAKAAVSAPVSDDQPVENPAQAVLDIEVQNALGLEKQLAAQLAEKLKLDPAQEQALLESLTANIKSPSTSSKRSELLANHLADVGRANPDALAQIVRTWVQDGEESRVLLPMLKSPLPSCPGCAKPPS